MEPKTTVTNGLDEIANFTFTSKYARYSEKYKRRESWKEAGLKKCTLKSTTFSAKKINKKSNGHLI